MTLTLAQRTQQRKRAAAQAAAAPAQASMAGHSAYELHLAQLHQHYQQLKQVQSTEGKAELKAKLLEQYQPYVAGVLSAGQGAQDEVITTLLVWHIDAGSIASALNIAEYVLTHGLTLPDRFNRDVATLVADEVGEYALKVIKQGPFDPALLERAIVLTASHDMPDEARAKLHLALGRAYLFGLDPKADVYTPEAAERMTQAEHHISRAIELHTNCGGKKDLEQAKRLLKKHASTAG